MAEEIEKWEQRRHRIEKELKYRLDFEKLIMSISSRFISLRPDKVDGGINLALKELGEFVKVDRVYVFLFSADGSETSNTHEWCTPGIEPQKEKLQGIRSEEIKWWVERLRKLEVIHVPRVNRMPPAAAREQKILEMQGIKSVLVVPMSLGEELLGFVGFDSVRRTKNWNQEHIKLLRIASEILVNAMERRRADATNRMYRSRLQQAQKLEIAGRMAGSLAHDFNNLLQGIIGLSDFALSNLKPGNPLQADMIEIKKAGERAAALISRLLTFSRRQVHHLKPVNLNHLLVDMENFLRRLSGEHIRIELKLASELGEIKIDQNNLEQVLLNLVLNARDAMPRGGRLSIATSEIELDGEKTGLEDKGRKGRFACLEVRDTGTGIKQELRKHLFEPFFTTKSSGVGLGLTSVIGIVEQNQGWVEFSSEPNRETVFRVFLPAVKAAAKKKKVLVPRMENLKGQGEKILIVEDDQTARALVSRILNSHHYRVWTAKSPTEAKQIFQRRKGDFDLIFCDVVMPGLSGLDLIEEWRRKRPDLKFLLSSGYLDKERHLPEIQEKRYPFLPKPFDLAGLIKAVREAIEGDRRRKDDG